MTIKKFTPKLTRFSNPKLNVPLFQQQEPQENAKITFNFDTINDGFKKNGLLGIKSRLQQEFEVENVEFAQMNNGRSELKWEQNGFQYVLSSPVKIVETISTNPTTPSAEEIIIKEEPSNEPILNENIVVEEDVIIDESVSSTSNPSLTNTKMGYTKQELFEQGFISDYMLSLYFNNNDGMYSIKENLKIEGQDVRSIEEIKTLLQMNSFDEFIENNYSTEAGSGLTMNGCYYNNDTTLSYLADYLHENYGAIYGSFSDVDVQEKFDIYLNDIAIRLGCKKEDLSEADVVKALRQDYSEYCKSINSSYEEYIISEVLQFDSLADFQLENYVNKHSTGYLRYLDSASDIESIIMNDDKGMLNLDLTKAIFDAAGIGANDSKEVMVEKIKTLTGSLSQYNCTWQVLIQYLIENSYLQQKTYSEAEVGMYGLTDDAKNKYFYPAIDKNGNQITDENGNLKYYKTRTFNVYELTTDELTGKVDPTKVLTKEVAYSYGVTPVTNAQELQLALQNGESVILLNDIDMSSIADWVPIGTESNPYIGKIYGNGFSIKNLNMEGSGTSLGMFGVFAGEAYNLNLEGISIKNFNNDENSNTGVFAGKIVPNPKRSEENDGTVYDSKLAHVYIKNSSVSANGNAALLAGSVEDDKKLAGSGDTLIFDCSVSGSVEGVIAGGLIGSYNGGLLKNISSLAEVKGEKFAGGILGVAYNLVYTEEVGHGYVNVENNIKDAKFNGKIYPKNENCISGKYTAQIRISDEMHSLLSASRGVNFDLEKILENIYYDLLGYDTRYDISRFIEYFGDFLVTEVKTDNENKNLYYKAIMLIYKQGFNITQDSPWVCEKNGIFYEFDKEKGIFVEKNN